MPPVALLLRTDLLSLRNRLRAVERRRFWLMLTAIPLLGLAVLIPAGAVGASAATLGTAAANGLLTLGYTSLGMIMLVVGLSSVMVSFFTARDLLLLAAAPIRLRDIYLARLLVAARGSALVAALLLASVIGYGVAARAGLGYWIAAPLTIACVVLAVTALQVALLSAVVRVVPIARARTLVSVIAALMGTVFWLVWLVVRSQDIAGGGDSLVTGASSAAGLGDRLVWLPIAWPARALAGFAGGDSSAPLWLLSTLLFTATMVLLGYSVFVHAFRRGLSALGEVPRRTTTASPRRVATLAGTRSSARPRTALTALVGKEWLVMRRDSRRLAALIPLCAIAALYPLVAPGVRGGGSDFWPSVLRGGTVSVMLPFFFTQILAAPAVALEGRAFLLMRLAPVPITTLLRAKVIAVGVPMTLATLASTLILGIVHHGGALDVVALLLMGTWLAAGATTIGVAGGAIGARFEAEDPRRAVNTGAALTSSLASLAFLGLSVVAMLQFASATHLTAPTATRFDGGPGPGEGAAMLAGFVCVAIAVSIVVVMLTAAQRRLERWQPDGGRAPLVVQPVQWAAPPG
ncbi:MAG TPA: hypothetical protein VGQ42_12645 [Candidatus Dormibacteraeota bacterium]|jgi:ABC-2 type transport system permease protein|nr:hypothetical protein [Candidatus Dormibacteraeota bacterium]